MFRLLASILLFFSFFVQTFRGSFIILDYYTNTASFAKNCINKSKPALHCKGKCQMVKKIQEEEKKESNLPQRKFENKIEVYTEIAGKFYISAQVVPAKTTNQEYNGSDALQDMSFDFFHPPQA